MDSNIAVTISGNRAAASAYLLVLISKDGNHRSLPPGRYACELIKEDTGQWRFSRHIVFHDHDYTLDGSVAKLAGQAEDHLRRASGPASKFSKMPQPTI